MPDPVRPMVPIAPEAHRLRKVEHYTLYLLNSMAAAGSGALSDGDIDYAIDVAERLFQRLVERGHLEPNQ
jgi:hypothetical protein